MFEKISRSMFINVHENKRVTLLDSRSMTVDRLNECMNMFTNTEFYAHAIEIKVDKKYTGILHKCSSGFFRKLENDEKSYASFAKGSYIMSDLNKFSMLITPVNPMWTDDDDKSLYNVILYRIENNWYILCDSSVCYISN